VPHWITDPAELNARIAQRPQRIGLDTEFIRERTYWPQLALVQIALGDGASHDGVDDDDILLVDPLAPGITDALRPLLTDPSVLKVMHSASEDLVAFKHACGVVPQPLFDTQIAAALSGIAAGIGYQRLVQDTLGIALSKGETRSDWLRRPLSPAQLEYAADDVRHLFALHDALGAQLRQLGREDWMAEDCARMTGNAERDDAERWPHLALRAAQFLDVAAQHRLLRLLRWRDAYARESDRPRNWILDNELATLLARDPPADPVALQRQLDAHPKAPRKLGDTVWQALHTALDDEADAPEPRNEDRDRQALRRLQEATTARSAELGLPDGVLASRRWLELLLGNVGTGVSEWPGPLSGWRRAQLEPVLAPLLAAAPAGSGLASSTSV
jgi:ribonuclease D